MAQTASGKPTYLGLLNSVSLAETRAHGYLSEWASITESSEVREVLLRVAAREGEHGMTFAKRINELGYELRPGPAGDGDKARDIVRSECSDIDKFEALGLHKLDTGDQPDVFDGFFKDHTIDIRTGEMLGRYIAEERDSGRLLRDCYAKLCESRQAERDTKTSKGSKADKATSKQLAHLGSKVDALSRAVDELRQIVCAQSMPTVAN